MMQFEIPKERPSIIKVIGVGGGGSNAVNHMFRLGIKGVDFMICNTDHQALEMSPVPVRVQLGPSLTDGRGAGSIPEIGKNAAIENIDEIRSILSQNTKMVFITAGMGGGTGTGAAPIIAGLAKEMGILTVAIVTVPFAFEGKKRKGQADSGIEELKKNVDTLLVICNDRLREIHGNLKLSEAFVHADDVLAVAAKSIAETITKTLHINVDFADVQTVLKESGVAIMGSASAEGEDRALSAIMNALDSPLLNDNNIEGARYILLNITSGTTEVTMDEVGQITDYIQEQAGNSAEVIMGVGNDESLGEKVSVTVIATGFKTKDQLSNVIPEKKEKVVFKLMDDPAPVAEAPVAAPVQQQPVQSEVPSRDWAQPLRQVPIIAEKVFVPAPAPSPVQSAPTVNEPAGQTENTSFGFFTEPVTFDPQPVDELDVNPMLFAQMSFQSDSVIEDSGSKPEIIMATASEITGEQSDISDEVVVHQLFEEEFSPEPVISDENDGFLLKIVTDEELSLLSDEASSSELGLQTPEAEFQVEQEAPVVFELMDETEIATEPVEETDPMEPVLVTKSAEVIQEEENTFVFELNMPAMETDSVIAEENVSLPEAEMEVPSEIEVPSVPVMSAVPPVESVSVGSLPSEPSYQEADTDENNEAFVRARARIMQLRELSMKMNSTTGLADLEKEPAYKRRNVQLNNLPQHGDSQISRYTLSSDHENKPEIRPNNPFLHDRVD